MDFKDIKSRFGLVVKTHRIGLFDLRVAEVDQVDDMVRELYPGGVTVHGDAPVWMITWPAAFCLAEHLALNEVVAEARLLELGCGTAAPGIAAALAGARVVSTDYDPLTVALAGYNAGLNGCSVFEARFLDWYHPDLSGRFDFIVGSEIVYFAQSFSPLLAVLKQYLAPGGRIILSDQGRPQMKVFLEMALQAGFLVSEQTQTVHLPELSRSIRIVCLTKDDK